VRSRLEDATAYWFASTRADGRPHVVPRDGIWLHETLWYGGGDDTVHTANVRRHSSVVAHIGDGTVAVIVEGIVAHERPDRTTAEALAHATMRKYPQYGSIAPDGYVKDGAWVLRPKRVIAWTEFPADATRFVFQ
jgi:Pyridoxamine 5'-phosphate oxidase